MSKLVEIPAEWYGHVTHKQTIRKHPSKQGQGASFIFLIVISLIFKVFS